MVISNKCDVDIPKFCGNNFIKQIAMPVLKNHVIPQVLRLGQLSKC